MLKPHLSFCPSPHSVDLKWSLRVIKSNEPKKLYCLQGNSFKQSFAKKPPKKPRLGNTFNFFTHEAVA